MSLLGGTMTGDIWSTGAFSFDSPLKDLIDSGDYTLEQLMAEDELLQELRGVHPQLIQFFSTPASVTKLVQYVVLPLDAPPSPRNGVREEEDQGEASAVVGDQEASSKPSVLDKEPGAWLREHLQANPKSSGKSKTPEKDPVLRHIRFPYMACEIICCEIPGIVDALVDGQVVTAQDASQENTPHQIVPTSDDNVEVVEPPWKRILDLLFSVLYTTPEGRLDDYRAGYFDKILTVLFRKRPEEMRTYINGGGGRGDEVMMKAMFKHLYAHSVMQIAQRLLLPQRPVPPKQEDDDGAEITAGEADPGDGMIRCDWSKSNVAIDLLLDSLYGPGTQPESELVAEQRLDRSLNASEVLITIIQNSMLSSQTMLTLTSSATIARLVQAATTVMPNHQGEEVFSPHESLLTSAMNVLESLILQLGGYGAIGTMSLLPEEHGSEPPSPSSGQDFNEDEDGKQLISDLTAMVEHLPNLLDQLCKLLRHSSTKKWSSPTQFSRTKEEQFLGNSRLRIVRVLESLVLLGDPDVDTKLVESDCLELCLDLFWEFQWCSMLHQSVANLLVHVFEGHNARVDMQEYFLIKSNLLGRLMNSFNEETDVAVEASRDKISVSEDDVDAAMEKQEAEGESEEQATGDTSVRTEPLDTSMPNLHAPPQSFRLGYMGHVIIICQALVHACTVGMDQGDDQMQEYEPSTLDNVERKLSRDLEGASSHDSCDTGIYDDQESLLLAEMINTHPLSERWQEFIQTTLATETAIQSTPLGGFNSSAPPRDPLQSLRPGPDDGDILGDEGLGPPSPPRVAGDELISLDDNELDMAATMYLGRSNPLAGADGGGGASYVEDDSSGSYNSGDSEKSYNSGETANSGSGYAFDDPLGKAGGLGIELEKLTQYRPEAYGKAGGAPAARKPAPKEPEKQEEEDDDDSSSDEEPDTPPSGDDDPPVMNLFPPNSFQETSSSSGEELSDAPPAWDSKASSEPPPSWDAFASFDSATADNDFGAFESALEETPPTAKETVDLAQAFSKVGIDDIFGKTDAISLLEEEPIEKVEEGAAEKAEPEEAVAVVASSEEAEAAPVPTSEAETTLVATPEAEPVATPELKAEPLSTPEAEPVVEPVESAEPETAATVTDPADETKSGAVMTAAQEEKSIASSA